MDTRPGDDDLPGAHTDIPPTDSLTGEPPVFSAPRASTISLTGAEENMGDFFRGLGPRRMKIAVFGVGGTLLVIALAAALR